MNNTRFATAIHILVLLAKYSDQWLSSEWIAGSINVNPVIVRKELINLQTANLVGSRKGKEGGYKLEKLASQISIADVYLSIKSSEILGKKNTNPNPKCPVGKLINDKLTNLFDETEAMLVDSLSGKSLQDFVNTFD